MIYQETLTISTKDNGDLHDLTEPVSSIIKKAKITTGSDCYCLR